MLRKIIVSLEENSEWENSPNMTYWIFYIGITRKYRLIPSKNYHYSVLPTSIITYNFEELNHNGNLAIWA